MQKTIQVNIFSFVNFPQKVVTISQAEMWKLKLHGGLKLINIDTKSNASKVKWLIDIVSKPDLKTSFDIFTALIGTQKGNITGHDLLFLETSYNQRNLKTNSTYYKDALLLLSKLDRGKGILNIDKWDSEHIFFNPLITMQNGNTIKLTKYYENRHIFKLEQLFQEKAKESRKQGFDKKVTSLYDGIILKFTPQENILYSNEREEIKFSHVTHKQVYETALIPLYYDHHSQTKWAEKLNNVVPWDKVWKNVHNFLGTNETKTVIWQQLHLNFYTQYSYNKWHKVNDKCPLCHKVPESVYHIILHCDMTNNLWNDIQPALKRLHPMPISDEEKAMGILESNTTIAVMLRNWVTFLLRRCIVDSEKEAYHNPAEINIKNKIKRKLNKAIALEIDMKAFRYRHENNLALFEKIFMHAQVLCEKHGNEEYMIHNIFT